MKLSLLSAALLLGALAGCRSPQANPAPGATAACTCGEAMADFEGCAHPLCLAGQRNPDNPDCVCGPLELGQEGGAR